MPLVTYAQQQPVVLVTFESIPPLASRLAYLRTLYPHISLIIARKIPYIGWPSLWFARAQLKRIIAAYQTYRLIARGPHAAWLCLSINHSTACCALTIQARALVAQEYWYMHRKKSGLSKLIHAFRGYQLYWLERSVYTHMRILVQQLTCPVYIEAISCALKKYLMQQFSVPESIIALAVHDIPPMLDLSLKNKWRSEIRQLLGIADSTLVYCYNGSAKPWQCPDHVITFFKEKVQDSSSLFLLILTTDTKIFTMLLNKAQIPHTFSTILNIAHNQVIKYLAAADYGIIFREPHLINWISRPVKVLEYQAAHLSIIHNNTIAYLQQYK